MTDQTRISLLPYIDILARYRFAGICAFAAGLFLTFLLLAMMPRTYSSAATLIFAPSGIGRLNTGAPEMKGQLDARIQTLAIRVLSTAHLSALIRKYNLYHPRSKSPHMLEDISAYMRKHIIIEPLKPETVHQSQFESRIFRLAYEYSSPAITRAVVYDLAELLVQEDFTQHLREADDGVRFITKQLSSLGIELDARSEAIRRFEQEHRGSLPQDLNANLNMLGALHGELDDTRRSLAAIETRGMELQRKMAEALSKSTSPSNPADPASFSSPAEAITALETRLTILRAQYSEQHPDIIRLREDIAALKQHTADQKGNGKEEGQNPLLVELKRQSKVLSDQIRALEAQSTLLEKQIAECRDRIAATPSTEQRLTSLNRDYDVLAKHYHELMEQRLAAEASRNLDRDHGGEHLQILESPKIPIHPVFPTSASFLFSGFIISLCFGTALPFALFFTNTSYSSPEELQRQCGLPVLASIPVLDRGSAAAAPFRWGRKNW